MTPEEAIMSRPFAIAAIIILVAALVIYYILFLLRKRGFREGLRECVKVLKEKTDLEELDQAWRRISYLADNHSVYVGDIGVTEEDLRQLHIRWGRIQLNEYFNTLSSGELYQEDNSEEISEEIEALVRGFNLKNITHQDLGFPQDFDYRQEMIRRIYEGRLKRAKGYLARYREFGEMDDFMGVIDEFIDANASIEDLGLVREEEEILYQLFEAILAVKRNSNKTKGN